MVPYKALHKSNKLSVPYSLWIRVFYSILYNLRETNLKKVTKISENASEMVQDKMTKMGKSDQKKRKTELLSLDRIVRGRAVQLIQIWIAITILASNDHKNDYFAHYVLQVISYLVLCCEFFFFIAKLEKYEGKFHRSGYCHCWFV